MRFLKSLAATISASPLLFSSLVSAQTWSNCNPMKQDGCPDNPALSGTYRHSYGGAAPDFSAIQPNNILYKEDGAHFRVSKSKDAPTLTSNFYIMYGKLEVKMKAAPGAGIVSSLVLQSETLDEIDWEWLGGKPNEAQSNYFGKGNTETYDRGAVHGVADHTQWHTYGIEWTAQKVDWIIDGQVVRTLTPAQVKGDFYPQTPMQIKLGSWSGGDPDNAQGTIQWAGGPTDYSKGPFDMVVADIFVQDYSSGKFYRYTDKSGSAKSIISVGGAIGSGASSETHPPIAVTPKPTNTADSPLTTFRAPTNSGRIVSSTTTSKPSPTDDADDDKDEGSNTTKPAPTSTSSPSDSDSDSGSDSGSDKGNNGNNGNDSNNGNNNNNNNNNDDSKDTDAPLTVDDDSGAGKPVVGAFVALVAVGAALVL